MVGVGEFPIGPDYRMVPLTFGWAPSPDQYLIALSIIVVIAGTLGGMAARSELASGSDDLPTNSETTLGVKNGHWWWLWFPMSTWATAVPSAVYLCWLLLASGGHWMMHPSIWFNWRWYLFFSFGAMTTYLPYMLLVAGISGAWGALAQGRVDGESRWRVALRFVGWAYGCGFCALWVSVLIGGWVLSKLPIVSDGKPWWVLF